MILLQLFSHNNKDTKKGIEKTSKQDKSSLEGYLPHAEKPKPFSCFKDVTTWDVLEAFIVPVLLVLIASFMTWHWDDKVEQESDKKYQAQLVQNYIHSITELILDQYHHGKSDKYPEISVKEVESFIKAKTANTLKALNSSKSKCHWWSPNCWRRKIWEKFTSSDPPETIQKQNLINFLSEAGIGFFPPYKYQGNDRRVLIQNVCPSPSSSQDIDGETYLISEEKDITFHHFFCNIELSKVVLNKVELKAVIWEGANLYDAEMQKVNLEQADLQGASLNHVDLTGANLTKANLKSAYLHEVILKDAILSQANLRGATLGIPHIRKQKDDERVATLGIPHIRKQKDHEKKPQPTDLENAELPGVNLRGANLKEVIFKNANMEAFCVIKPQSERECEREIRTNLRNANLRGANLRGANLRGANLRGVTTDWKTNWEGVVYDEKTEGPTFIDRAKIEGKGKETMIKIHPELGQDDDELNNLKVLGLSDVDLRGADLKNANLSGVDLSRADLRGIDKNDEICEEDMSKCITVTDMSNANLEGAKLKDALYDNNTKLPISEEEAEKKGMIKIFPRANLEEKDIRYTDLSGVDLSKAQLQEAKLSNVDFDDKTKWEGAKFDLKTELPFDRNTAIDYNMRFSPLVINWEGKNLQKENLQNAILKGGDLKYTILKQAQLQKADLTGADLTGADLTGANLNRATLTRVTLKEANLTDANLRGVVATDKDKFVEELNETFLCRTALPHDINDKLKGLGVDAKNRDCLKENKTTTTP